MWSCRAITPHPPLVTCTWGIAGNRKFNKPPLYRLLQVGVSRVAWVLGYPDIRKSELGWTRISVPDIRVGRAKRAQIFFEVFARKTSGNCKTKRRAKRAQDFFGGYFREKHRKIEKKKKGARSAPRIFGGYFRGKPRKIREILTKSGISATPEIRVGLGYPTETHSELSNSESLPTLIWTHVWATGTHFRMTGTHF